MDNSSNLFRMKKLRKFLSLLVVYLKSHVVFFSVVTVLLMFIIHYYYMKDHIGTFAFELILILPIGVLFTYRSASKGTPLSSNIDANHFSWTKDDSLVKLLECPICLNSLTPPIYQCKEGHTLCVDCRNKLLRCPVCRTSVDIRNRVLDEISQSIDNVACYYAKNGCTEQMKLKSRREHENSCEFRPLSCLRREFGCLYEGSPDELILHLFSVHKYEQFKSNKISLVCDRQFIQDINAPSHPNVLWQRHIYSCYDTHFILRVCCFNKKELGIGLRFIIWGNSIKHSLYRYHLTVQVQDGRKFQFEDNPLSCTKEFNVDEFRSNSLIVPMDITSLINDEESGIPFALSIRGEIFQKEENN